MVMTFQDDLFLLITQIHEDYNGLFNNFIKESNYNVSSAEQHNKFFCELNLEEAELLIKYIKEYKIILKLASEKLTQIKNIKNKLKLEDKIENELNLKMLPIANIYRILLQEKYNSERRTPTIEHSLINDQD